MIDKVRLIKDLSSLGLSKGDIVNVKVSMKSIGTIDGGANTLIEAILDVIGPEGTLVCDSFNECVSRYFRIFHKKNIIDRYSKSYAGAFVNAVIAHPNSYRSSHPIQAFTAIGALAQQLTDNHTINSRPYAFLEQMASLGAKNLRIGNKVVGVGTTHIPICRLGYKQKFLPIGLYYKDENGKVRWYDHYWASGCHAGFNRLIPRYEEIGATILGAGFVGEAESKLTDMKSTLAFESELLKEDGTAFFCDDPGCLMCSFTWKHSKYTFWQCFTTNLKRKNVRRAVGAVSIALFGKWHG